jgi:hypothetical protein
MVKILNVHEEDSDYEGIKMTRLMTMYALDKNEY